VEAENMVNISTKPSILIISGPNLNLLGTREPSVYGHSTLDDIEVSCVRQAETLGLEVSFYQSNSESEIIDWIQKARNLHDGVIINAGAFSHTSIAILDALLAVDIPVIEIHLSNVFQREPFRHHSYITQAAIGMICGFGAQSYLIALDAIARLIRKESLSNRYESNS
jgi:3-dehydroquinate dehydratase-2